MKKQRSKRGLIAMLFVTVLAIVIAMSARMLKGSETTYAASQNLVCKEGTWNSALGKCVVYSDYETHTANTCDINGTILWKNSSNSTKAGWLRADQSAEPSIANANKVQYYATSSQLRDAGAANTKQTDTYYGSDGAATLCKNIMNWRFEGMNNPVSITAKFRFYKLVDPVAGEPAGSMTYRECTQAASKSISNAEGSGSFTHCVQYTCTNGTCTSKLLTNAYQIVCANGNANKYSPLSTSGTCRTLEKNKNGISGTFYCTDIYNYNCDKTSTGSKYEVKTEQPAISSAMSSCVLDVSQTNKVGENIVQHCNSVTCKGGRWSEKETTIGNTSLGCPTGYKRVDYSDGFLVNGSKYGECDANGNVATSGTCVDGSKRACVFKAHYMCVEDKTTNEDEKLKTYAASDFEITGIPEYVKVGDEFGIYVRVPSEVSNFDKYMIQLKSSNAKVFNQNDAEYKLSSDNSVVVFPVKAKSEGSVTLTIGVKNAPQTNTTIKFDVHAIRDNDSKVGGATPQCQIKVLDTAPATVWSNAKYLKVEFTNPDEATLSDINPFLWSDGRAVESRAVLVKRDYSVTVTGLNGKTGECKITAEELGNLETSAPKILNSKAANNGVITFDASDTGGSGLDYYYIQEPGKPVVLATYTDENGYTHDVLSDTVYDSMSETKVRSYGIKFSSCKTNNFCSVTYNVRESGTYYIYILDKANNVTKQKIEVNIEGTPYIDELYFSENVTSGTIGLMEQSTYGNKLIRLSNTNYKTDSLVKQMAFSFDRTKTEYEITTSSPTITIYATLKSTDKSFVAGFEPPAANTALKYGANEFTIKVADKNGKTRAYTIIVNRIDDRSGVNVLENLTVGCNDIGFNENITDYDVNVAKDVTQVSLNAILKSGKASFVDGYGPRIVDISSDDVTAELKVQSEAGSIRTYTIRFHRVADAESGSITSGKKPVTNVKGSNYLSSLTIPGTNVQLSKERLTYNVYVPYTTLSVKIYAFAEDPKANVVIDAPTSLRVGSNTATVSVVSTENKTRTYTITIIRKEDELGISSNTKLGSLEVLGYNIGFDRDKTNYELKIDKEKNLFIAATPESDRSEVYIIGNEDLTTFSTVKLSVIAEDGTEDVYSIQISKDVWNLRNEIIITVVGLAVVIGVTVIYQVRRKKKLKKLSID